MHKKDLVQGSNCYGINPAKRIILHGRYDMGHRKRNAKSLQHVIFRIQMP